MNLYKTGLTRLGAYLLLGGMLTIPVSCDRDKDSPVRPIETTNRGAKTDQAGCGEFTTGKFLGTWTFTGSRLQVLVVGNSQYVTQIFNDNEFYVRGKEFLRRTDIANKAYSENQPNCFEGDPGDAQGFGVSTFQPPAGFEPAPTPGAYRVSCSPRFTPGAPVGIAFWTSGGSPLEGRFLTDQNNSTQLWLVQNVTQQTGFNRDAFVIRGRNILLRSDVQNFQDPWDIGRRYCFAGGDTGIGGLQQPGNAPQQISGFTKMFFPDNTPYFIKNP